MFQILDKNLKRKKVHMQFLNIQKTKAEELEKGIFIEEQESRRLETQPLKDVEGRISTPLLQIL